MRSRSSSAPTGPAPRSTVLTGSGGLTKTGTGLLDLGGENTYSGPTTIVASRLKIDFTQLTAPLQNIINYAGFSSPLVLSAGTLLVQEAPPHPNSQTFNNTDINAGSSEIAVNGSSVLLNLENLVRNTGSTVDFTLPSGTPSTTNGIVTNTGNANGIIGAYATVSGTDWAASGGANGFITAYSGYTPGNLGTLASAPTANVKPTGTQNAVTSSLQFYTLNLSGSVGVTMTGAGALTLADGGLLCSSTGSSIAGAVISGGTLQAASNGELIVNTASNLTIGSVIPQNGTVMALTKAGTATLILTGNNTYNGMTTVGQGTLQVGNGGGSGSLGLSSTVTDYGALVFDLSSALTYPGLITGAGNLTQAGSGATTLTGSSNYTGATTILGGHADDRQRRHRGLDWCHQRSAGQRQPRFQSYRRRDVLSDHRRQRQPVAGGYGRPVPPGQQYLLGRHDGLWRHAASGQRRHRRVFEQFRREPVE